MEISDKETYSNVGNEMKNVGEYSRTEERVM